MSREYEARSRCRRAALTMLHIQSNSVSSIVDAESDPVALPVPVARNSMPEIFTFDVESVQATACRRGPMGPRSKRPRRVLYPAKTRKYLPPPEIDRPLRWLYILCLVVCVQICCEESTQDTQLFPLEVVMPSVQPYDLPVPYEPKVTYPDYSQSANYTLETNLTRADALSHNDTYSQGERHSLTALFNDTNLLWLYHQR